MAGCVCTVQWTVGRSLSKPLSALSEWVQGTSPRLRSASFAKVWPMERRLLVYSIVRLKHLRLRDSRTVQRQGRWRGVRRVSVT